MYPLRRALTSGYLEYMKKKYTFHRRRTTCHAQQFVRGKSVCYTKFRGRTKPRSKIDAVSVSTFGDIISVKANDGESIRFPSIWLRDNCRCSRCYNETSRSRTIDWSRFDFKVKPIDAKSEGGNYLTIDWSDGHTSNFSLEWLISHEFTEEKRKHYRDNVYRFQRVTWSAKDFQTFCRKFDYNAILKSDFQLLNWLESLTRFGVALVRGTPMELDSCRSLTERVAFARKTHYGEKFLVTHKEGTTNVAYLTSPLHLHTDLPYYHYKPGANFLHCYQQCRGDGGDSLLTDVFHVANILRDVDPRAYEILTKTLIDWNDIGEEDGRRFHSIHQAPVLCEDEFGDIVRVNFSQPQRDSQLNIPLERVVPWYRAMGSFVKLLYSSENLVTFKLKEGEILTFDNLRIVHGRTGYVDTTGMERRIIGCYVDWDEIYSRIRTLRRDVRESSSDD